MKRTTSIATVLAAAVLIGGSGYSALATGGTDRHGGGPEDRPSATASPAPALSTSSRSLTAAQAAAAARKVYPGTVTEVEVDGDHPGYWEVHIVGADRIRREVRVDTRTGAVILDRRVGDHRPGDDHAGSTGTGTGGDRRGSGQGGSTSIGDDRPGDDHGVHGGGDDRLKAWDDQAGDDDGRGRGRGRGRDHDRGGHGVDDH
ncbi:PepSY domain-containing protein [Streptomyces sp. NPDC005706]|uniref:PepSY domain-containing protein n=1 Tax=Streptomyces sp. NPDC005706 TaxID=3157169 RepID=UPI003405EB6B